jgi:hypothetical protein
MILHNGWTLKIAVPRVRRPQVEAMDVWTAVLAGFGLVGLLVMGGG